MKRLVCKLKDVDFNDFVNNNEFEKGDIIEILNPTVLTTFMVDSEFFKLNDPDVLEEDDITKFELISNDTTKVIFTYEDYKFFDEIEEYDDEVATIYGKAILVDNQGVQTKLKGFLFIIL